MHSRNARLLTAVTAAVAVVALVLQYGLLIHATWDTKGPLRATVQFLSYFTIVSNLLVALACMAALARNPGRVFRFFQRERTRGAIALYIAVTGLIYLTILSASWAPVGWQWLANVTLHYAVPILYLALWALLTPRRSLEWRDAASWLMVPLVYFAWVLLRGAIAHEYPYPFINADALGIFPVIRNAIGVLACLVAIALALIAFNRSLAPTRATDAAP
jgi:hypothetical protein